MRATLRYLRGALVSLLLAAGCTSSHGTTTHEYGSASSTGHGFELVAAGNGAPLTPIPTGYGARLDPGSLLTVRSGGSGSCPWRPDAVTLPGNGRIVIHVHLRTPGSGVCTTDLVTQYFVLRLPQPPAVHGPLTLTVQSGSPLNRDRQVRVYRAAVTSPRAACLDLAKSDGGPPGRRGASRFVRQAVRVGVDASNETLRSDFQQLAAAGASGHSQRSADALDQAARDCQAEGDWANYH